MEKFAKLNTCFPKRDPVYYTGILRHKNKGTKMSVTVFAYTLWSNNSYYFPSNLLMKLLCVEI